MVPRFLVAAVLVLVSGVASAQVNTNRVHGSIDINPPVPDPIDVVIDLQDRTGSSIKQFSPDRYRAHRFSDVVPAGVDGDVAIVVTVNAPSGYVPWQKSYVKRACCEFYQRILLKRPADLYQDNMVRAAAASSPAEALAFLTAAAEHAGTFGQQLEVQRQLGQAYAAQQDFAAQQEALKAVGDHPELVDLTPARKQAYWGERLDGILNWAGYTQLREPQKDFGSVVAGDPALQRSWSEFVSDFQASFPAEVDATTTGEPSALSTQLKDVMGTLKRPK